MTGPKLEYLLTDGIPVMKVTGISSSPFVIKPVIIHYMSRLYYILGMYPEGSADDLTPLVYTDLESLMGIYIKQDIMPFLWECSGSPGSLVSFEISDDIINPFIHDLGKWFSLNYKED